MNSVIVHIEVFQSFEEVGFYTIRQEGQEESETDRMILRFGEEEHHTYIEGYQEDFDDIINWIEQIGIRGLHICRLRHENEAHALPPNRSFAGDLTIVGGNRLRLYCIQLSPQILVLCGGGIKEGQTVQESPDLGEAFRLANKVAKKITEKISQQEIRIHFQELIGDLEIWL